MTEFDPYKVVAYLDVLIKAAQAGFDMPHIKAQASRELMELNEVLRPKPVEPVPPSAIPSQLELDLDTNTRRL